LLAGKYRVERIIGQGGMGVVVEARHIVLDERVALKFLQPDFALHPEGSARFLREARAAVKIKSEHVARVLDTGTLESGAPYMVMEFLEGNDLARTLEQQGVLALEDAVDFITQGCEAIAEAHAHGIVHRDMKPANLFLTRRPDGSPLVKVLDFGISKVATGGVDNLTRTTASMGSALYMSPEQMQQTRSVDHRTDIYALGVALFELLAGRPPFYADTLPQLCAEVLTGTPVPLRAARPDVPAPFAAALERAYARDRNHRYASVAELVVALAPFAPARTHPTIDRIARMGGLPPPMAGAGGQRASQASYPGYVPPGAPPAPEPAWGAAGGPGALAAQPAEPTPLPGASGLDETAPLPDGRPSPMPASHAPGSDLAGLHQIVPGPYQAPMSTRAAATFASSTGSGLYTSDRRTTGWSTSATLALASAAAAVGVVLAVLTIGRRKAEHAPGAEPPQPIAEAPASAAPAPPPPEASAPSVTPSVAAAEAPAPPSTSASASAAPRVAPNRPAPAPPPVRPPSHGTSQPRSPKPLDLNDPH
jgi:eukaryotic-like serine/threonine-protein kinase